MIVNETAGLVLLISQQPIGNFKNQLAKFVSPVTCHHLLNACISHVTWPKCRL